MKGSDYCCFLGAWRLHVEDCVHSGLHSTKWNEYSRRPWKCEGAATHDVQGETERIGFVQSWKVKATMGILLLSTTPSSRVLKKNPKQPKTTKQAKTKLELSDVYIGRHIMLMKHSGKKLKHGKFWLEVRKRSFTMWVIELRTGFLPSDILGDIQNLTGHNYEQPAVTGPALCRALNCVTPGGPFQLACFCDSMKNEPLCRYRENLRGGKCVYMFRWD